MKNKIQKVLSGIGYAMTGLILMTSGRFVMGMSLNYLKYLRDSNAAIPFDFEIWPLLILFLTFIWGAVLLWKGLTKIYKKDIA